MIMLWLQHPNNDSYVIDLVKFHRALDQSLETVACGVYGKQENVNGFETKFYLQSDSNSNSKINL